MSAPRLSLAEDTALLALEALKLQQSDIQTTNVGAQASRLAALKSGAVACAPVGMDLEPELKGQLT